MSVVVWEAASKPFLGILLLFIIRLYAYRIHTHQNTQLPKTIPFRCPKLGPDQRLMFEIDPAIFWNQYLGVFAFFALSWSPFWTAPRANAKTNWMIGFFLLLKPENTLTIFTKAKICECGGGVWGCANIRSFILHPLIRLVSGLNVVESGLKLFKVVWTGLRWFK